jgi:hypothetical protein
MRIVSHPANIDALMKTVQSGKFDGQLRGWESVELIRNDLMERDKPNGKYQLPDGRTVEKADVIVSTRFIDYGPEDVDYLVMTWAIKECREMKFLIMDDSLLRFRMDYGITFPISRHILIAGCV